jgi:hypothetical protein
MTLPSSRQPAGSSRRDRPRQVSPDRFPMVRTLLRGYLHEGYAAEHGSAEGAVRAFCKDASSQDREKLVEEWRRLSVNTASWTVADIRVLLTSDFGGAWMPESKQELTRLFQVIRSAAAPGAHA